MTLLTLSSPPRDAEKVAPLEKPLEGAAALEFDGRAEHGTV